MGGSAAWKVTNLPKLWALDHRLKYLPGVGFRKCFSGLDEKRGLWGEWLQQEENKQGVNEARGFFSSSVIAFCCSGACHCWHRHCDGHIYSDLVAHGVPEEGAPISPGLGRESQPHFQERWRVGDARGEYGGYSGSVGGHSENP